MTMKNKSTRPSARQRKARAEAAPATTGNHAGDAAPVPEATTSPTAAPTATGPRKTKAAALREMLQHPDGASLASMMEATGWQAHTVRAALTGLRKTGLNVARFRVAEDTVYRIVGEAADGSGADATAPDDGTSTVLAGASQ